MATIIALNRLGLEGDGQEVVVRIEQPLDVPGADLAVQIDLRVGANASTRQLGEHIHAQLSRHPGVQAAIERAVTRPDGAVNPIFFQASGFAEEHPWEALFHPTARFLSRDRRWPIARMVRGGGSVEERTYQPPVRICAVLGALGVDARPEWMAIRGAIIAVGLDCKATVFASTPELFETVQSETDFEAEAVMIPDDVYELQRQIRERRPHLLHFFCHGSSAYGANLEVANLLAESGQSPLYLDASQLQPLGRIAWLISVNACEGASPFENGHSLAYQVVQGGAPAVYAMRKAVSASDAHAFCGGLFTEALDHLEQALDEGQTHELDWTAIQAPARERMLQRLGGHPERNAENRAEWTLPVLYVRPGPLRVRTLPDDPQTGSDAERIHGQLEVLRDFRAELHPDSPQGVRDSVDAHIRSLEEALAQPVVRGESANAEGGVATGESG